MQIVPATPEQADLIAQGWMQPSDERAAQNGLPRSQDPLWATLAKSKVVFNDETGLFSITQPPDVEALDGKTVTLKGFVLPMDGSDQTKHFLVTKNTPVCLFCPPGAPNEIVEVISPRAIEWTDNQVSVTGTMRLINDGEKALFFKIEAVTVKS
jgi:hypothetical protein